MKIKKFKYLILLILIMLALSSCNSETPRLKNNSFESTSKSRITSWRTYDYERDSNGETSISSIKSVDGGYNGGKCLQIDSNAYNDVRAYQKIKVAPNTIYKIKCMVKYDGIGIEGAGANISGINSTGRSNPLNGTNNEWTEMSVVGRTGTKQKSLELSLGIGGYSAASTGKAWFDNISIERLDAVPDGTSEISFESTIEEAKNTNTNKNIPFKILFMALICGLVVYTVMLVIKTEKYKHVNNIPLSEPIIKPGRKDWIIIGILTIIYACIAFYNLGDFKSASSYYKSQKADDFITIDFGEQRKLSRIIYSYNVEQSGDGAGLYDVFYENPDVKDAYTHLINIKNGAFFEWQYQDVSDNILTSKVRISVITPRLALNEIGFFEKNSKGELVKIPFTISQVNAKSLEGAGDPKKLFDEQDIVPVRPTFMNSTYFDEVYFPRTAYENIHSMTVYETTHPPLGKIIIASGIQLLGMAPFGWRFMGTLFGVLMVPAMYLFGLKIFKNRFYAFAGAFLMTFDFMHLAQTRLATIDSFSTFFIIMMYYFMYDYFTYKSYDLTFKKSLKPLLFCGIMFGLGAATKWICLYSGAGLAFLFLLAKYIEADDIFTDRAKTDENKPWWKFNFIPTSLMCVIFFIVIPGIIYALSYIPYTFAPGDKTLLEIILDNQKYMYNYHSGLTATHPFGSPWMTWPINGRPIWYFNGTDLPANIRSTVASFGNPAIWWVSIPAIFFSVYVAWKKRDKGMLVVFVAYAFQFFPWILVTRVAFIYHYFSAVPFLIFMIIYSIKYLVDRGAIAKYIVYLYLAIVLALFIIYLPVLTGALSSSKYIESLRLFSSWYF